VDITIITIGMLTITTTTIIPTDATKSLERSRNKEHVKGHWSRHAAGKIMDDKKLQAEGKWTGRKEKPAELSVMGRMPRRSMTTTISRD
jgi:hypothetical protein